jgi:hypothetical protein
VDSHRRTSGPPVTWKRMPFAILQNSFMSIRGQHAAAGHA